MIKRKLLRSAPALLLVLLTLMVGFTPVYAQDTLGLSDADFELLGNAIQGTTFQESYSFAFTFALNVNAEGQEVSANIDGTGAIHDGASNRTSAQLAIDGEVTAEGQTLPITAEFRTLDGFLYMNLVNPETGEESGWVGDLLTTILTVVPQVAAGGAGFSPDALMGAPGMDSALSGLSEIDPEQFLSIERGDGEPVNGVDTTRYTWTLNIAELVATDQIAALLFGAIAGTGQSAAPPSEAEMAMIGPLLGQLFGDATFTVDQYIDEANSLVRRAVVSLELNLDPSTMGTTGDPVVVSLNLDVTLDDFGTAPEVEVPADVQMGFASAIVPSGEAPLVQPTAIPLPTQAADAPAQPSEALVLFADEPIEVEFDNAPVEIAYESAGGETISISARSTGSNSLDTTLEIFNADGVSLSRNDDHGSDRDDLSTFDSLISELELEDAGTYTITLNTFGGSGNGTVEILLESSGSTPDEEATPSKDDEGGSAAAGEQVIDAEVPDNGAFEFEFEGSEGQTVTIAARASDGSFDPVIELQDPSGDAVAENDDHGTDREDLARFDSMIENYELEDSGTYTVRVRGFAGSGGEFELLLSFDGEGGGSVGGGSSEGPQVVDVITEEVRSGDTFEYELEANAGDVYTISVRSLDEDFDPVLALYDGASGDFLASNDDHGSSDRDLSFFDSRIERYIVAEDGAYIVEVQGYGDSGGEFELSVELIATDAPLGRGEEEVITGEIGGSDSFTQSFDASAGDYVTITVRALTDEFDASVSLISPDGVVLADNDDHGGNDANLSFLDARINNFIISEDGEYTVEVVGYRDSAGTFALIINIK